MFRSADTRCATRNCSFAGRLRTACEFFTVSFKIVASSCGSVILRHTIIFNVLSHDFSTIRKRRVSESITHFNEHSATLVVHFNVAFFSGNHVCIVEALVTSKVNVLLEDRLSLIVVTRQLLNNADTFCKLFFVRLTVEFLFTNLSSHRHEEEADLVRCTEGPLFRCIGSRLRVVTDSNLQDFRKLLDGSILLLLLARNRDGFHLGVFHFAEVVSSFSRNARISILDLETILVVSVNRLLVVVSRILIILEFAISTSRSDVSSDELFLIRRIGLRKEDVCVSSFGPALCILVSNRNAEGSIQSVGALRIITNEVLGAADCFFRKFCFIIGQASAVKHARSLFVIVILLIRDFVSLSGHLLVRNGVVGCSSETDCSKCHRILFEVVRNEEERLGGLFRLTSLLISHCSAENTLDGKRRRTVVHREHHERRCSLFIIVSLFICGTGFEHSLIREGFLRVMLNEVQVSKSTLFELAILHSLIGLLEEHGSNRCTDDLSHGVIAGRLDVGVLLQEPFEFLLGFIQSFGFEEGLSKHTANEQDVLVIRVVRLQSAEVHNSLLVLLSLVADDCRVVSEFHSFLLLTELLHVLVDLSEVSLGFREIVSLHRIIASLILLSVGTSLIHHDDSVVAGIFLLIRSSRTESATTITVRIGVHDLVEHISSLRILAHFLIDESQVCIDLVFIPRRFRLVMSQEFIIALDSDAIALLSTFRIAFLHQLCSLSVIVLRDVEHCRTDSSFCIFYRLRILLILLVPRRILAVTLHNELTLFLSFVKLLLKDQDFDHGHVGKRSVHVVRVDVEQVLEGLYGFFVTVVILVLHTDTVVEGVLEVDLLILEELCSHADTVIDIRECGSHKVHRFKTQVARILTLIGTIDIDVVSLSGDFVFSNVIVRFCQVVHGESRFLTREVFETGHALVSIDRIAELTVHEVIFCDTEPGLRDKAVIREFLHKTHTELVCLFFFTTSFINERSLIHHVRSSSFLRILVNVFQEIAQGLGVVNLRTRAEVFALCRFVITVFAPRNIFFVLSHGIDLMLFFQTILVVTKLLKSTSAARALLALATVYLSTPLLNGGLHFAFIHATGTACLLSLGFQKVIGARALLIFVGAFFHRLALGEHGLRFVRLILTRICVSDTCKGEKRQSDQK